MSTLTQVLVIGCSTAMLGVSMYLLSIFNRLFSRVRNTWLRKNLAVLLVAVSFMFSLLSVSTETIMKLTQKNWVHAIVTQLWQSTLIVLFVFNTVWVVGRLRWVKRLSFIKYHIIVIVTIITAAMIIYSAVNYFSHGMKFENLKATLIFSFYNACATGLIYTAVNYVDLDRKRKLNEKELEVARLNALKNKAELDALHSKVNPHFLYNALNSIADLSITDGRKARRMTIALADLFRYSINYSQNNYSTVNDEVDMTETYMQIEKIRFEDQLNYSVNIDEESRHYLLPRFMLQPLTENAVKHGLKATGKMTQVHLEVSKTDRGLTINIADNGPAFPTEIVPGYGVKSVFDKLDLLFPGEYEILFSNEPRKQVTIHLHKLMKNEPAV